MADAVAIEQMDLKELQRQIDQIAWYHEFDFPHGLVARSQNHTELHRKIWTFIARELDRIDFTGKTVLDLGCWDGYWSFYAERRGAKQVLATDDNSQNWTGNAGVLLAKKLLGSSIDVQLDVSVYDLVRLRRTFDVIFCFGIYYHLVDPFYAFSQLRHCCHPGTLVLLEGDCSHGLAKTSIHYDLSDHSLPIFAPAPEALAQMLHANYLKVLSMSSMQAQLGALAASQKRTKLRRRIWPKSKKDENIERPALQSLDRMFTVCQPFEGSNPMHMYRPPFGLHRYDDRFRDDSVPRPPS